MNTALTSGARKVGKDARHRNGELWRQLVERLNEREYRCGGSTSESERQIGRGGECRVECFSGAVAVVVVVGGGECGEHNVLQQLLEELERLAVVGRQGTSVHGREGGEERAHGGVADGRMRAVELVEDREHGDERHRRELGGLVGRRMRLGLDLRRGLATHVRQQLLQQLGVLALALVREALRAQGQLRAHLTREIETNLRKAVEARGVGRVADIDRER